MTIIVIKFCFLLQKWSLGENIVWLVTSHVLWLSKWPWHSSSCAILTFLWCPSSARPVHQAHVNTSSFHATNLVIVLSVILPLSFTCNASTYDIKDLFYNLMLLCKIFKHVTHVIVLCLLLKFWWTWAEAFIINV